MKRIIVLLLIALLTLTAPAAWAADSGYRFESPELGVKMALNEKWMDGVDAGKLSFWVRADKKVAVGDVLGYAVVYATPDLSDFHPESYAQGEKWLDQNAMPIGGVIAAKAKDADLSAIRPDMKKKPLGKAGNVYFTLMRAPEQPSASGEKMSALVKSVYQALDDTGRFILNDPSLDYGILGAFEAPDLAGGENIDNDYVAGATLTVVNFWSTTCNPCISELPRLAQLAKTYADRDVRFLGIVIDALDEKTQAQAAQILKDAGVQYPNISPVISNDTLRRVQYTPTTIFLNRAGKTVGKSVVGDADDWDKIIKDRLSKAK